MGRRLRRPQHACWSRQWCASAPQTIMELFPVHGPVEVRQIGVGTPVTEAAKRRVQEDLEHDADPPDAGVSLRD